MLQDGVDVNVRRADGATALAWAAHWDDVDTAARLIEAGADPNAANALGVTPLMLPGTNRGARMATLLLDLLARAYQTDLTRVGTFMLSREVSGRAYPEIGVPDAHHGCSHHQNDPARLEKLAKINTFHMQQFAYFLDKLQSTPDGDGTLLDHSMLIYGSGISDGNIHFHMDLPIIVAGGGGGTLQGGRHLRYASDTPLTNLYVSVLDKLGVPVEQFGDSTGKLPYLSEIQKPRRFACRAPASTLAHRHHVRCVGGEAAQELVAVAVAPAVPIAARRLRRSLVPDHGRPVGRAASGRNSG